MLKGLLMRRQSSQVSNSAMSPSPPLTTVDAEAIDASDSSLAINGESSLLGPTGQTTIFGDQSQDQGGEVRFSVELTRLDRLEDMYSLDIRRLKGNLKSYKFLYDSLRE
jgi:protein-serine/threonine kinase